MKNKTNCENNVELLSLETRNLLHGYMTKEISFLENYRMG
jgi:ribosomal protein S17E